MTLKGGYRISDGFKIALCSFVIIIGAAGAQTLKPDTRDGRVRVELTSDWLPTAAMVSRVEALLKMPRKVGKLENYDRYWMGKLDKGRKHIYGYLTSKEFDPAPRHPGRVIITKYAMIDPIMDGGCMTVEVLYDLQRDRILRHLCIGGFMFAGRHAPPGW